MRTLVEGVGRAEGDTVVLDQTVRLEDRAPTRRTWRLTRIAPGGCAGTLTDAAGPVEGEVRGGRLRLSSRRRRGLLARQWLVLAPGGRSVRNVMPMTALGVPVAHLDETIARE